LTNLLSIESMPLENIQRVLDVARQTGFEKLPGRVVVNLFYEASTRTRLSFELAARRLGADVITFDPETSSEKKGESMKDTALTLQALGADVLVIRHSESGVPKFMSDFVNCSVVNAGDGTHEHPTQALLDLYTIRQRFGQIAGLRVGIVGDVKHSRVAHSLYLALAKMGAETVLIGPRRFLTSRPGPYVSYSLDTELASLDVCYVLRTQKERHQHAFDPGGVAYKLTTRRATMLPDHAIVMHPGPMNRGEEIDSEVADSPRSAILDQVTNGVAVRAAVLQEMMRGR